MFDSWWRPSRSFFSVTVVLWLIGGWWFLLFFPGWYSLSYTKVWELKQMVGRSREQQLQVMHPAPMRDLVALSAQLQRSSLPISSSVVITTDRSRTLPLAGNVAVVRGVLWPFSVLSWAEARYVQLPETVYVLVPSLASPLRESRHDCLYRGACGCPQLPFFSGKIQYWEVRS